MRIYHHVLARITLFVAAFLLSNSALCYGQSAYQFLKVTGKLKEDNAAVQVVSRHLRAPITSAKLAKRVAGLKDPGSLRVFSDYRIINKHKKKLYLPRINIVAQYQAPLLKSPAALWGSYRYLHLLIGFSRDGANVDLAYQDEWKRIDNPSSYRGVHHIVNKTTLKQIYERMEAAAAAENKIYPIRLSDMQKDAPGSFHPFHGKEKFSSIFHNSQRQLELYEQGGVKLIILDYFKSLERLAKDYPQEAPKVPAEVVKNTLLEAKLWANTFLLRWE